MSSTSQERERHGLQESLYLLPADEEETQRWVTRDCDDSDQTRENLADTPDLRLNLQHVVLQRSFDGKLWSAPIQLFDLKNQNVLDAGCGTGIWLFDLSNRLEKEGIKPASLYGIDITEKQFPKSPSLLVRPQSVAPSLSVGNVLSKPSDYNDRFTLIHQRLLIAGLAAPEWECALANHLHSLKPGGWLQLFEAGSIQSYAHGSAGNKFGQFRASAFKRKNMLSDIGTRLPNLLKQAGFINVESVEKTIGLGGKYGQEGIDASNNFIGVYKGMKGPFVKAGFVQADEYDTLMEDLYKQWEEEGTLQPFIAVHGQKPL